VSAIPSAAQCNQLYLADTLSAFALPSCLPPGATINWSKTPFSLLERNGRLPFNTAERIFRRFDSYCSTVAALGFNAVTVDDVAHLSARQWYPRRLRDAIADYAALFARLCNSAKRHGLSVFVNTDAQCGPMRGRPYGVTDAILLAEESCNLFKQFPQVAGIIARIGECDGLDVDHEMRSNLSLRTPAQVRTFLRTILPVFESCNKTLVLRTWTIGAFQVGDLMWNPRTYRAVFDGISSGSLVVSHKYGVTDFFRYLSVNPLIFEGPQRKLVEFQARREYEGFGEFPSFVGDYYERIRLSLARCANLAGIMVWCQTGGWSRFRNSTFMPESSLYNEINAAVTVSLFANGDGVEAAVLRFCATRRIDAKLMLRLLRLSSGVIESLWYMPEFSRNTIFFRRTRVPPLLWVFWDTIVISATLRVFVRRFARGRVSAQRTAIALGKIDEMREIAARLGLETQPFVLMRETFGIIGMVHEYLKSDANAAILARIKESVDIYEKNFPRAKRFSVVCDFASPRAETALLKIMFLALLRPRASYRLFDRLLYNRLGAAIIPIAKSWNKRRLPAFVRERGMGFETLLR
jgi:hypothetical protein